MRDDYNSPKKDSKASTDKDPIVDYVVREFERYESFHQQRFEKAREICNFWENHPPAREWDWQNAINVPVMIEGEQTITPRLFSALFPSEAPVECKVFGDTTEAQGTIIKNLIRHKFIQSDVQGEVLPGLSQCTLLGTGYLETSWLMEWQWINTIHDQQVRIISQNRPDCRSVDFFEMFPHPAKMRVQDPLPLIRRQWVDAEYIKKLFINPKFKFEKLDKALQSEPVAKTKSSYITDEKGNYQEMKKRDEYELLHYWGPWDESYLKDDSVVKREAVPYWTIVVNRAVAIRAIRNPFNHQRPPFCKYILYPDIKPSWFGVGIGQVGYSTQERLNKVVNQRLDNVDLVLNKQGFYNGNDMLINHRKLQISRPGQWHKVSDTATSIRWMDIPDVTQSSYEEERIAKQDFRESTGAFQVLQPGEEKQHRTAMGINLLQGAAGMRFRPVLRKMEVDLIRDLAQMYLSMLQQFMPLPEWIMAINEDGTAQPLQVSPADIQGKVLFVPTGLSELMEKEVQIGQLMRFKELTVNDPTINRQELNRRLAELLGFKDIKKLLTPPRPEIKPGGLSPQEQQIIQQRIAEGADPEQIKLELLGQPPAPEEVME